MIIMLLVYVSEQHLPEMEIGVARVLLGRLQSKQNRENLFAAKSGLEKRPIKRFRYKYCAGVQVLLMANG